MNKYKKNSECKLITEMNGQEYEYYEWADKRASTIGDQNTREQVTVFKT